MQLSLDFTQNYKRGFSQPRIPDSSSGSKQKELNPCGIFVLSFPTVYSTSANPFQEELAPVGQTGQDWTWNRASVTGPRVGHSPLSPMTLLANSY